MIHLQNIHSLTDFQRNTKQHLKRLKESGLPEVLTINGKAELVVQNAESYQRLLELADRAEAIEGIRRGLESMKRGEGHPAEEFFKEMEEKYNIPSDV